MHIERVSSKQIAVLHGICSHEPSCVLEYQEQLKQTRAIRETLLAAICIDSVREVAQHNHEDLPTVHSVGSCVSVFDHPKNTGMRSSIGLIGRAFDLFGCAVFSQWTKCENGVSSPIVHLYPPQADNEEFS